MDILSKGELLCKVLLDALVLGARIKKLLKRAGVSGPLYTRFFWNSFMKTRIDLFHLSLSYGMNLARQADGKADGGGQDVPCVHLHRMLSVQG